MAEKEEEMSVSDSVNAFQRFLNMVGSAENLLGALKTAQAAEGKKADWERQEREAEKRKIGIQSDIADLEHVLDAKTAYFQGQVEAMDQELKIAKENHEKELAELENHHAGQIAALADELKERKTEVQKEKRNLADDLKLTRAVFESEKLDLVGKKDALLAEIEGLESYRNEIREKLGQASA